MRLKWLIAIVVIVIALSVQSVSASTGVGVGLGEIRLEEDLKPGGIYRLPDLPVINTGDVAGDYRVSAEVVEALVIADPDEVAGWVEFTPREFHLDPGASRLVSQQLQLPVAAPAGEYLVFLEAAAAPPSDAPVAIGAAAATKLYFSVAPGSVLGALRQRVTTWVLLNHWIYLLLAVLALLMAVFIFRRNYQFSIQTRPRDKL